MAGKKDEKDPKDIMANLPERFSDDDPTDLGKGGSGDPDDDSDLDEDLEEKKPGEEDNDDEKDEDDKDDEDEDADLDEDDDKDDEVDDPAKKPAPKSEEEQLLDGEKLSKLQGGEFISKKSFLKRLKKEAEGKKTLQAQLDAAKPLLERKAEFETYEKNKPVYERQNAYLAQQKVVLDQDPILSQLLKDRMTGKPTNWAEMTQYLKPYLAPFWDGVQIEELDPTAQALAVARQTQERLDNYEKTQQATAQQQQEQAAAQQRQQKHVSTFAEQEKKVWAKHTAYAEEPFYKNMLLDAAQAAQDLLADGQVVDLEKIADKVFGDLDKIAAKKRAERKAAKDRVRLAAGERSGGVPGIPVKKADPNEKLEPRAEVKKSILARFGNKF